MASSSPLAHLTKNFFVCSVCLDKFKEPKLLPCLHRYCEDCLDKIMQANNGGKTFQCPFCKNNCEIPKDGVNGFKTDFHMKKMLEFIHKSSEDNLAFKACQQHTNKEAELCCGTCENIPVCTICVHGKHKGHDLHDVEVEAERQRKSLEQKHIEINKHKDKIYELPIKIENSIHKLKENVRKESTEITLWHDQQVQSVKDKLRQTKAEREEHMENLDRRKEKETNEIRRKHEEELKQVEENYNQEFGKAGKKYDQMFEELEKKLESLSSNLKELTEEREEMSKENESELQTISEYYKHIIEQYETFTATTTRILDCNDKWAYAQRIPDIIAVGELLLMEMKKEFQELESLTSFETLDLSKLFTDVVSTLKRNESTIIVKGLKTDVFKINSLSSGSDGELVITGASKGYSHITVINRDGKIQRQKKMEHPKFSPPLSNCCRIAEFKVATVCPLYDTGIYDVRDGSYISKDIKAIIPDCKTVTCVTFHPIKDYIIVGTTGRDLHVFDDLLNYIKTLQLPDKARHQIDMVVHKGTGYLLVCSNTRSAYVVRMSASSSHILREFTKGDLDGSNWQPYSVCTDQNGLIYMLWRTYNSDQNRHFLLQYSQCGQRILTQIPTDNNLSCMTTVKPDETELIVVADNEKLYTYSLITM